MFESPLLQAKSMMESLAAAQSKVLELANFDAAVLSATQCLEFVESVESCRTLLDSVELAVLGRIDAESIPTQELGMRSAHWLAWKANLPARVARQRLKNARLLASVLPDAAAELSNGTVTAEHISVLDRVTNHRNADAMADIVGEMCADAAGTSFERWSRDVTRAAQELDQDGSYDPSEDDPVSKLNMSRTGELLRLSAELFGPLGKLVESAIAQATDELYGEVRRTPDLGTRLDERGVPRPVPASALRAEALGRLCERGLGVDLDSSRGPRDSVTLVLNPAEPDMVADELGCIVEHQRYGAVLCDPTFHPLVMSIDGIPLDAGRDIRYANRQQRRAAALRDGGCVFPGCGMPPSWCDTHHVQEWHAQGGTSDIANLACLCRFHHGVVHRKGWSMTASDDGWFSFTTPSGQVLGSQRRGRQRGPAPP